MTIDSSYYVELYAEDGGVIYPFQYEVIALPECVGVYKVTTAGARVLIPTTDYTVEFNDYTQPMSDGGVITLNTPLLDGETLSIQRNTPITQEQVFPNGQPFNANAFEFAIDKYTMILQEIDGHICDCRAGSGAAPPGDVFGAITQGIIVAHAPNNWNNTLGYDGTPLAFASPDGTKMVMAFRGTVDVYHSEDGGATWKAQSAVLPPAGATNLTTLAYNPAGTVAYASWYDTTGRGARLYSSSNNGDTWDYVGSVGAGQQGALFYDGLLIQGSYGSAVSPPRARKYPNFPSLTPVEERIFPAGFVGDGSQEQAYRHYDFGTGKILIMFGGVNSSVNDGVIMPRDADFMTGDIVSLKNRFCPGEVAPGTSSARYGASDGQGRIIVQKYSDGTVVNANTTWFVVNDDYDGSSVLQEYILTFPAPVRAAFACFWPPENRWVISAQDSVDTKLLHIAISDTRDLALPENWTFLTVTIAGKAMAINDARQLTWISGNDFLYSYIQNLTLLPLTVEKITLLTTPAPPDSYLPTDDSYNLRLWYTADKRTSVTGLYNSTQTLYTVSKLYDQGNYGAHVPDGTPAEVYWPGHVVNGLNGKYVVSFNGGQFLGHESALALLLNKTKFMTLVVVKNSGISNGIIFTLESQSSNVMKIDLTANGLGCTKSGSATRYAITNPTPPPNGEWHILAGTIDLGTGDAWMHVNGTEMAHDSVFTTGVFENANARKLRIGTYAGTSLGQWFTGEIAEILFIEDESGEAARQKLEGYLAWKWGLEAELDPSHPYAGAAPPPP